MDLVHKTACWRAMHVLLLPLLLQLQLAALLATAQQQPEQVRLAIGMSPDNMAVQFVTPDEVARPTVHYGLSPEALVHSAPAESFKFTVDKGRLWYNHIANMTDLVPATKYFYRVVTSPSSSSQIFHFRSQDNAETLPASLPQFHVIYGDMGTKCAFTLCPACSCDQYCNASTCASNHSVGVVSEVGLYAQVEREATMVLHVGDFAVCTLVSRVRALLLRLCIGTIG